MTTLRALSGRGLVLLAATCLGASAAAQSVHDVIDDAVRDVARPPADMERDAARKPAEVIEFSGMKPGDIVLELQPGGGYWTRMFSRVVGPQGGVYAFYVAPPRRPGGPPPAAAAGGAAPPGAPPVAAPAAGGPPPPSVPGVPPSNNAMAQPVVAIQHVRGYENILAIQESVGSGEHISIGVPAQADIAWTAQNYHDYHTAMGNMLAFDKAVFRDLKPGGIFIVIDHAATAGSGFTQSASLHRVEKEAVKQEVISAGFEFVADSNVLANATDQHTEPVFQLHDQTDQFILKFRKPRNAANTDLRPKDSVMKNIYGNTFVLGTADQRFRTIFYHPDHTYQEFGQNDMQAAYWYWDADGYNCMYHQFPAKDEGFTTCHPWSDAHTNAKLGVSFKEYGVPGGPGATVTVVKGYQYPNTSQWPK